MNKTKFLVALAVPALLAACSQDEFTENTQKTVDLSSRKVVENVALNFGEGAETRAGIGTTAYNSYAWTEEDGVGACIIDDNTFSIVDYISSNYKYYFTNENQWKTDALMVEGNYMFYAPYNEKHLVRSNITASVPTTQNVKVQKEDNNAIAEFYASGSTVFAGYKLLSAENQPKVIDVAMRHIFSYPLFTLINKYDVRTPAQIADKADPIYKDIKIVKVVLKSNTEAFGVGFEATNANIKSNLAMDTDGKNLVWDADKHESAATTDIFDVAKDADGAELTAKEITMNLGDGFTLKGEENLSFYAVLPAAAYAKGLNAVAYDADGNSYSVSAKEPRTGLTLNPGYRYPAQEYNKDNSLKPSAGQLLTYELKEKNAAPTDIVDNDDFIAYLKSLTVRYNILTQVANAAAVSNESEFVLNKDAEIVINSELIDALVNYNYSASTGGSVKFSTDAANATFTISSDVVVKNADATTAGEVKMTIVSATGKEYEVTLPTATATNGVIAADAKGTFVIGATAAAITLAVDSDVASPVNVIVVGGTDGVTFNGVNANKISSLNVVSGKFTVDGKVEGLQINNSGEMAINSNVLVSSKIVNNKGGIITNDGTMYAKTNVNNGTITTTATSVTNVNSGIGEIDNTKLGSVAATQKVYWSGLVAGITTDKTGLAAAGDAKYGINYVRITDTPIITLAQLKAPVKGCTVSTVELTAANLELTMTKGGSMAGLTLVLNPGLGTTVNWIGDNFAAPVFTNANLRIKDGVTVKVSFATASGTLDKTVTGFKTGKIEALDGTGTVTFK